MINLKDCRLGDRSQARALCDLTSMSYLWQIALTLVHQGTPLTLFWCSSRTQQCHTWQLPVFFSEDFSPSQCVGLAGCRRSVVQFFEERLDVSGASFAMRLKQYYPVKPADSLHSQISHPQTSLHLVRLTQSQLRAAGKAGWAVF